MTFTEHLVELRNCLTRSAIAVLLGFFVAYNWHLELFELIARPLLDGLAANGIFKLQALQITETIIVYVKVSAVAAVLGTSPYIFYQLWSFVGPGLLPHEQRWILPIATFSALFFFLGVSFAYKVMMPFMTGFLAEMTQEGGRVELVLTVSNAFGFSLTSMLLFGVIFELPLVIFFLSVLGVVNHTKLIKGFRYFVVVAFIVGAILTPPDPISQSLMAVPLIGLYGIGILISWLVGKRKGDGAVAGGRFWATVVVALAFVGVVIGTLGVLLQPAPRAVELVPARVAMVSGVVPAHLGDLARPSLDAALQAVGADEGQREALRGPLESADAVLLVVEGGRAALLAPGAAAGGALPPGLAEPEAGVAPGDTLVFGHATVVDAVMACASDEDLCLGADPRHMRRLDDLSRGGPLWAYAPDAADPWRALLPLGSEVEAAHDLAVVITPSPDDAEARLSLALPDAAAARSWRARALAWREQRERDLLQEQRSATQGAELLGLAESVRELAAATRTLAEAGDRGARDSVLLRLDAVAARLDRAALPPTTLAVGGQSLIDRLPPEELRSWEVSTDDAVAVLTLKVAAAAVPRLLAAIDEAARPPLGEAEDVEASVAVPGESDAGAPRGGEVVPDAGAAPADGGPTAALPDAGAHRVGDRPDATVGDGGAAATRDGAGGGVPDTGAAAGRDAAGTAVLDAGAAAGRSAAGTAVLDAGAATNSMHGAEASDSSPDAGPAPTLR